MKIFDSILDAVRHIKNNLPHDINDRTFLMTHSDNDTFYVASEQDDLTKIIERDFYEWGYDGNNPEDFAKDYKIWAYVQSENKDRWTFLYRDYKRSPLSTNHIRGKANAAGETVASFSVEMY